MLGLLLTLLGVGILLYFLLQHAKGTAGGSDVGNAVNCESRVSSLVSTSGGVGPAAQAAWEKLPPECRKLIPEPAALAPAPAPAAQEP